MSKTKQLYDALRKLSVPGVAVFPGIVKQVQADTVDVEVDGIMYYDVRLQSITEGEKGIRLKPKTDSVVLLQRIGNSGSNEFFVCLFSEIDQMSIEIGSTRLQQNAAGFQVAKGNDSLKAIISDLISEVLKIYAPMNKAAITAIRQRVNQLFE